MYYLPVTLILFSIFRYNNTNRGEWKNLSALLFFFFEHILCSFCFLFIFSHLSFLHRSNGMSCGSFLSFDFESYFLASILLGWAWFWMFVEGRRRSCDLACDFWVIEIWIRGFKEIGNRLSNFCCLYVVSDFFVW